MVHYPQPVKLLAEAIKTLAFGSKEAPQPGDPQKEATGRIWIASLQALTAALSFLAAKKL